jgi:hypothetical protein
MNGQQFAQAIDRIDAANRGDPRLLRDGDREVPHELLYSMRMTMWLDRLGPDAPEALRLAVRAQHICRWIIPRESYPMDRAGYLRWRSDLAKFHGEKVGQILREVGYDDATVARVQSLVRKENLKADPDTQCLEDVAALVFLEYELADFARKHASEGEKLIRILQRTWKKMSPRGQAAARQIQFGESEGRLLEKALNPTRAAPSPGEPEAS